MSLKLQQAVDRYVEDVCLGKTNETPHAYRNKLRRMIDYFGNRDIRSVTADDLEGFKRHLVNTKQKHRGKQLVEGQLSLFTIRTTLQTARQFWAWCARKKLIKTNPAEEFLLPKEPTIQPKALEAATFTKLLEAAKTEGEFWIRARNVALLLTLRDTGGRVSGVLNIALPELDVEKGIADTVEKGGRLAYLFLNEASQAAVKEWLPMRWGLNPSDEYVFISQRGSRLSRSGVYHILNHLSTAAGIENARHNPHAFRHAFARDAMEAGADINEVSQLMNHSSIYPTSKYYGRFAQKALKTLHAKTSPGANLPVVQLETFGELG